jgi:hypothetical protein
VAKPAGVEVIFSAFISVIVDHFTNKKLKNVFYYTGSRKCYFLK